jgi:hypothetical protein
MSEIYCYIARKDHQTGELLGGGNFGRGYREYCYDVYTSQGAFNGWKIAIEVIFETIRAKHHPNLPSPPECSYAYLTRGVALNGFAPDQGLFAFEVEVKDLLALSHIGDFTLLNSENKPGASEPFIPWVENTAHTYWSGHAPQVPELLTLSAIKVVRRIAQLEKSQFSLQKTGRISRCVADLTNAPFARLFASR